MEMTRLRCLGRLAYMTWSFVSETKGIDRCENLSEDGRIISEWVVKKLEGRRVD
jgi:hypothetical protein